MPDPSLLPLAAVRDYEMRYVAAVRKRRYRPSKFRTILRIDNTVPAWATHVETQKVTDHGSIKRVGENTGELPKPTFEKQAGRLNIFEFGASYDLGDRELERAAKTGVNVSAVKAETNQRRFEEFLDEVACLGGDLAVTAETKTEGATMPGLAKCSAVTPATAATKAAGGTTWANATAAEMVYDMNTAWNTILLNSKENYEADTILMPVESYLQCSQKPYSTLSSKTALVTFLEQQTSVRRVIPWNWLKTADAATTGPRMVAFCSQLEEVARFVICRELTDDQPRRISRAWTVDQFLIAAGVLIESPAGIAYVDGI